MILSLLLVAQPVAAQPVSTCGEVVVHDGDTIRCDGRRVRISNIDAPELAHSPRCDPRYLRAGKNPSWCDDALGLHSRDALQAFLRRGPVALHPEGTDRYGRILARLTVNGHDAGAYLVSQGLARTWIK